MLKPKKETPVEGFKVSDRMKRWLKQLSIGLKLKQRSDMEMQVVQQRRKQLGMYMQQLARAKPQQTLNEIEGQS